MLRIRRKIKLINGIFDSNMDVIILDPFHPETLTSISLAARLDNKLFILTLFPYNPLTSVFFGNIIAFCL
mgnify:CR=1 FL=1|jgi:hypothetical protein